MNVVEGPAAFVPGALLWSTADTVVYDAADRCLDDRADGPGAYLPRWSLLLLVCPGPACHLVLSTAANRLGYVDARCLLAAAAPSSGD